MESTRLKIKVGDHEFEAEGNTDVVQAQFAAFKELVLSVNAKANHAGPKVDKEDTVARPDAGLGTPLQLERIMRQDGRVVSLTARANSLDDAVLLLMFGQKVLRSNDSITGGEILDGLKQSGQSVPRIDRILDKLAVDGLVLKIGVGRASRYRMTNAGMSKAQEIARAVISLVA